MTILDTNVIIDLFRRDGSPAIDWSARQYGDALRRGDAVGCNLVVLAELSAKADRPETVLDRLAQFEIDLVDLSIEASFRAGRAFSEYRRRGGSRSAIFADFLIAGHAAAVGATFVTRDRRLAAYFPDLTLITPDPEDG